MTPNPKSSVDCRDASWWTGFINDWYPALNGAQERILVLKDIDLPGAADGDPKSKTINGQKNPTISITRGQPQIWQVGNVGADAFFDLEVEGLEFWILSRDGNPLEKPYKTTRLWLPPGARFTAFIYAATTGQHRIISRAVDTGPQRDPNPEVRLGTVVVDRPRPLPFGGPVGASEPGVPIPTRRGVRSAAAMSRNGPCATSPASTMSSTFTRPKHLLTGRRQLRAAPVLPPEGADRHLGREQPVQDARDARVVPPWAATITPA